MKRNTKKSVKGRKARAATPATLFDGMPLFLKLLPEGLTCVPGAPRPVLHLLTDLSECPASLTEGDWIRSHCDRFAQEKDPLALMEAVVTAVKLGVYPPVSLIRAVAVAFQTVLHSKGGTTLDTALGLRGAGLGTWTALTRRKKKADHHFLAFVMYCLSTVGPMSITDAAERLSFALESQPSQRFYPVDTLVQSFSRTWKKEFHLDELSRRSPLSHPANWPPARRAAFLSAYPSPSAPL